MNNIPLFLIIAFGTAGCLSTPEYPTPEYHQTQEELEDSIDSLLAKEYPKNKKGFRLTKNINEYGEVRYLPEYDYLTKEDVAAKITITSDSFKGTIEIDGPVINNSHNGEEGPRFRIYTLTYVRTLNGSNVVRLYVVTKDREWAFFDNCYDIKQSKLEFVEISREINKDKWSKYERCVEQFAAIISMDYLKNNSSGITVKFYGSNLPQGMIISLPSHYIQAFIEAIEQSRD